NAIAPGARTGRPGDAIQKSLRDLGKLGLTPGRLLSVTPQCPVRRKKPPRNGKNRMGVDVKEVGRPPLGTGRRWAVPLPSRFGCVTFSSASCFRHLAASAGLSQAS